MGEAVGVDVAVAVAVGVGVADAVAVPVGVGVKVAVGVGVAVPHGDIVVEFRGTGCNYVKVGILLSVYWHPLFFRTLPWAN